MFTWASWCLFVAIATKAALALAPLPSTMTVDPATGTFGLCFGATCANALSVSLYQISVNTNFDDANNVITSKTVLSDFSVLDPADLNDDSFADPLITRTDADDAPNDWQSGTLFARTCLRTRCNPRASNESEFERLRSAQEDALGVRLDIQHVQTDDDQIDSAFESYHNARGALHLNLSLVVSPSAGQSSVLPNVAVSFLVAAYETAGLTVSTTTSSSVDGHTYLKRVQFGSDMFMDLPEYTKQTYGVSTTRLFVEGASSDALRNLVLVTIWLGDMSGAYTYEAALSSLSLVDGITEAPTPAPAEVVNSDGVVVPTHLRTATGGTFGLCLDPSCSTNSTLSVALSGLETTGSSPMRVNRFANSPGFQFSAPSRHLLDGTSTEQITSDLSAFIPQSAVQPPSWRPLNDNASLLMVNVAQFLTATSVLYDNRWVDVPIGAVQFGFIIQNWNLASSNDTLEMSMTITLTQADGSLAPFAADYSVVRDDQNLTLFLADGNAIEFPTFAFVDDVKVPVDVRFTKPEPTGTSLVVTFAVRAFTGWLTYRPAILKTNVWPPVATPTPTPAPTPLPPLSTTMTADPKTGISTLCFDAQCVNSVSISLYQLKDGNTVLSDFSSLDSADLDNDGFADPLVIRNDDQYSPDWASGSLFARSCYSTPCKPRPSNISEFSQLSTTEDDAIGVQMGIEHVLDQDAQMEFPSESFNVSRGALRLRLLVVVSPRADAPTVKPSLSVSFLVAPYVNYGPYAIPAVSDVGGDMYVQIQFGMGMFLDVPKYAMVNGLERRIDVSFGIPTTDELRDLVVVTLAFGDAVGSVRSEVALSSFGINSPVTPTPAPTAATDSNNVIVPTQLFTSTGGSFGLCLDAACASRSAISLGFAGLQGDGSASMRISRFANSPAFHFSTPWRHRLDGTEIDVVTTTLEALVPQSAMRPLSGREAASGIMVYFKADLAQYQSATRVLYGDRWIDVSAGALQYGFTIQDWVFASTNDTLELSMAITLSQANGALVPIAADYSVTTDTKNLTLHLAGGHSIEFPTIAFADGVELPVGLHFERGDADSHSLVVSFTVSAFTGALMYRPAVVRANVTSALQSGVTPAFTPTPTPTPTRPPPSTTTMTVDPATGTFGLCFWANCANSFSMSLYQLTFDTELDFAANEVTSSTVLADFSTLDTADFNKDGVADAMITRTLDTVALPGWSDATLYARTCLSTRCNPRASNEAEFQAMRYPGKDAVGIRLGLEHVLDDKSEIDSAFESYSVVRGALRLNLSIAISPASDPSTTLPMFGVSFLVAAFEDHSPTIVTNSSNYVDGHMYLQRVSFGSDMFVDLPKYATVNGVDTPIYTVVKGQASGELEDLVLVTLMFGPVTRSVGYEAAVASKELVENIPIAVTPAPSPVRDAKGALLPTSMHTSPGGTFALCRDATCSTDGMLSMGFSGLRFTGNSPLQLTRFANSPAFEFGYPTRRVLNGTTTEVLSSYFVASVPRSASRPPRRYNGGSDPMFSAEIALFLGDASVLYGGQSIAVPRGALKFTIELRDWVFASPTDLLEMRMWINLEQGNSSLLPIGNDYFVKRVGDNVRLYIKNAMTIEFPTYAIADNATVVPVGVEIVSETTDVGVLVVVFQFPYFAHTLMYDPVMKDTMSTTTASTPAPTPTAIVLDKPKRIVDSWGVAGFLLGFLALVIVLSTIQCLKKTKVKLDFSKIIP